MADITVRVPSEHVASVRDGLLHIYSSAAEALQRAAADLAASHRDADDVRGHRVELGDLEDALDKIGWDYEPSEGAVEFSGHPEVLADVFAAVALQATEAIDDVIDRCRRNQADMADVRRALRFLSTTVELFAQAHGEADEG